VTDAEKLEYAELFLPPIEAYNIIVLHRQKQVNAVEILKRLECFSSRRAQMDILLCQMVSLQVVRPALENDIFKLQADFIHAYHLELGRQWKVTVFYTFCVNRRVRIFNIKIPIETTLENFTRKTCYDYFQAYDITLIFSLFVRVLYFN
jgi:hypothetical protein